MGLFGRIGTYGRMIKFSHSVFALPFALASAAAAFRLDPPVNGNSIIIVWWLVVCMVSARSAAMGLNRLADHEFDRLNPRTRERELPAGKISRGAAGAFIFFSSVIFMFSAYQLNEICFYLSPVALALVFAYSFTKRFTSWSHMVLGLCLAIAPAGSWLGITGSFHPGPLVIGLGVMFWVAGFDILYSTQDMEFDRKTGLKSIPALLGMERSFSIARMCHGAAFISFIAAAPVLELGYTYLAGVALIGVLLVYEHSLVKPMDRSRLNMAFFTMNGMIGFLYFAAIVADIYLRTA